MAAEDRRKAVLTAIPLLVEWAASGDVEVHDEAVAVLEEARGL